MENYIRLNVPKDLVELELKEKEKYNKMFGKELYNNIVNVVYSVVENEYIERRSNKSSNMDGVLEYAEYERAKMKTIR